MAEAAGDETGATTGSEGSWVPTPGCLKQQGSNTTTRADWPQRGRHRARVPTLAVWRRHGHSHWGSARKWQASAASGPQGQLAPGRRGCYPEAAAGKGSVAGAKASGGQAPGGLGAAQGKVSTFTSRHRQQRRSLASALYVMAAAHGHGGGGRKQNRGNLAHGAK